MANTGRRTHVIITINHGAAFVIINRRVTCGITKVAKKTTVLITALM